jgi:hypothetical protein
MLHQLRRQFAGIALPLTLVATAVVPMHRALAQDVFSAKSAAHLRDEYMADLDTVHAKIMALASAIPEEKYSWRPAPGVRSISEALMHVANEWYYWVPMSVAGKAPADFGPPKDAPARLEKITRKREVIAELNKSWTHGRAQLIAADASHLTAAYKPWGVPLDKAAFGMAGDLHEHLGQLIAYARSVDVKPPWTK